MKNGMLSGNKNRFSTTQAQRLQHAPAESAWYNARMILFLDFDGVLHPVKSTIDDIFCRTPLLEDFLLHEMPDWKVVLSTSWREPHRLDELFDFLPESLHCRILGTTVHDKDPGPKTMDPMLFQRSPRHAQALYYLQERGLQDAEWLALDDSASDFEPAAPQLVLCNPTQGITPEILVELRERYRLCYNKDIPSCSMSL